MIKYPSFYRNLSIDYRPVYMNPRSLDTDDVNAVFSLMSNSRRRRFLQELQRRGETELRDIARRIAAAEQEVPVEELERSDYRSVYVSLYQTHVPRLEDHGIISYDPDDKTVSLITCPTTHRMFALIDDKAEQPWTRYYTANMLVGVGLLVVVALVGETEIAWRIVAGIVGLVTGGPVVIDWALNDRTSERSLSKRVTE